MYKYIDISLYIYIFTYINTIYILYIYLVFYKANVLYLKNFTKYYYSDVKYDTGFWQILTCRKSCSIIQR